MNEKTVGQQQGGPWSALRPVAVDIAVPLGAYYAAHSVLGLGLVPSLAVSSVVPLVRTVAQLRRDRSVNGPALLMLMVNLVGIALSAVAGDPRLMIAKDGAVSSVIGLGMLASVVIGRPMMTAAMRPFIVRDEAEKEAAWERASGGALFRRYERAFTLVWGTALVAECVAKVVLAYTLPVATMAWLSTLLLVGAIVLAMVVGNVFAGKIAELVA
ncbi:VC0807 family protein [Kitasatospora sp. MMS16-BH015]|uniref:VC0807 family protein n=1 Tax=Kitasatospora sp. MMS16-BH015 TaxID=2018025 RepID=UPI0020C58627|nr:VC0807 family protein [Kitasatospora sp. MMS16-BH015]